MSEDKFSPGSYIQEEMQQRRWDMDELAERTGINWFRLARIVQGVEPIDNHDAGALAEAFGTSHELWINLDAAYRS